jgi:hypothetical protein
VRVLRVVEVGAAVEGRGHRGIGVRTGRRRRASGATGGAGEDGCGGGGGHGVRWWPEELAELEGLVGIRISVFGGRRHGRRLGRVGGGGSGVDRNWGRGGRGREVRGRGRVGTEGRGGRVASHFPHFALDLSLYFGLRVATRGAFVRSVLACQLF